MATLEERMEDQGSLDPWPEEPIGMDHPHFMAVMQAGMDAGILAGLGATIEEVVESTQARMGALFGEDVPRRRIEEVARREWNAVRAEIPDVPEDVLRSLIDVITHDSDWRREGVGGPRGCFVRDLGIRIYLKKWIHEKKSLPIGLHSVALAVDAEKVFEVRFPDVRRTARRIRAADRIARKDLPESGQSQEEWLSILGARALTGIFNLPELGTFCRPAGTSGLWDDFLRRESTHEWVRTCARYGGNLLWRPWNPDDPVCRLKREKAAADLRQGDGDPFHISPIHCPDGVTLWGLLLSRPVDGRLLFVYRKLNSLLRDLDERAVTTLDVNRIFAKEGASYNVWERPGF